MDRWHQFYKQARPWAVIAFLMAGAVCTSLADSLSWRQDENKVAAEINSWSLPKLLENVAEATGWQIFLEPGTQKTVSTKFKDRPPGDALRLLLGDLSFALLPQSNAPAKLFVFRTSVHEATQLIPPPESKSKSSTNAIPNELILTLKPGAKAEDLAKKLGAKIIGRVNGLNAYRFSFDSADAAQAAREQLKGNTDVESIDANYQVQRPEPSDPLTYSSAVPPFDLKARATGGGPIIGLVDTAIQPQGGNMDKFLLPGLSVAGDSHPSADAPTHGTSMFETILRGMSANGTDSSGVKILPVDVYGNNPLTSTFDVANGIYQAINSGATVINLSLGSSGDSPFLEKVIKAGAAQGVLFFGAAGNEPTTALSYPAAYPEVTAVTAGNRDGTIAPYANRGAFVQVLGPGTALISYGGQSWMVMGTSASTAYVSGLAGGMLDGSKMTGDQVLALIKNQLPFKR